MSIPDQLNQYKMVNRTLYVMEKGAPVAKSVPQLELGPHEVLIKPKAVALNPCDYKLAVENTGVGCDLAGDVIEVGVAVTSLKVGDKVAAMLKGANPLEPWQGAFSNEVKTHEDFVTKFPSLELGEGSEIPSEVVATHYEAAAAHALSTWTAAASIVGYNGIDLVKDSKKGSWALVYGASTSLGYESAQLLKYLGYEVVVVAGAQYKSLLEGIGHFVDRNGDWVKQSRELGGDNFDMIFDAFSSSATSSKALEVASKSKKVDFNVFLPVDVKAPENVTVHGIMVFFLLHDKIKFGDTEVPAPPAVFQKGPEIIKQVSSVIKAKGLKALPVHVLGNSLDDIPKAFKAMQDGASGYKIVVRLQ